MLRYMLDTNICIYVIRDRPAGLRDRFNELSEQLCVSTITLAELNFGAEKSARPIENCNILEEFLARLEIQPFSADAAFHYGRIRAELERAGRPIGLHDMLIGAHARSKGFTLVTNNRREFDRIPGLAIENWI